MDLASEKPEVVAKLRAMLAEFRLEVAKNKRPVGMVPNARTLVPRPGVAGEEGYRPTLSLPRKPRRR